ncbi:MAG: electron transfer flavoprotein subunit beta/FixA family protein [Elusimicrobiota bacterium]|nr:electron transfer flavoprotein subunit beta/FixA family protein [Elusimicrobiota bacterium]
MKILVCAKQIPDLASKLGPDTANLWLDETDLPFQINEYDEYAVEEAVKLKEQRGAEPTELTVLSVGPPRVLEMLKKALAMGCDRGVHIEDDESSTKDPWQIASLIAAYAEKENFDIIFTGMQSQDRGSAQVGPTLAEALGYACATTVIAFGLEGGVITAERELEGGARSVVKLKPPAVITCELGLNTPRYPTLPNIMKARKKPIAVLKSAELGVESPRLITEKFYAPVRKGGGLVLEGEAAGLAGKVIEILKERTTVLRG